MKQVIKIYAVVSALILFGLFTLLAFYPEAYGTILENLTNAIRSGDKITSIYGMTYTTMESIVLYGISLYLLNIIVNLVMLALAYVTESKFNTRIMLYVLILNIIILALGYTIVKLTVEMGIKAIGGIVNRRR